MATTMELFEIFRDVFGFDEEWEEKVMEKGRAEGWEKGLEEGREEERVKLVINLLTHGVDPAVISESSGLALDKIRKIAATL